MNEELQRERFEAWAKGAPLYADLEKDEDYDYYLERQTAEAWEAWTASIKSNET